MYRVFLADDEKWSLFALRNVIDWTEHSFAVCGEAEDGEQALKRILSLEPELVVSDIRMPEMDGLKLLEEIRKHKLNTQVIFVSGYTDFEYARQAIRYGCIGYLIKPVNEDELLQCLQKVKDCFPENEREPETAAEEFRELYHSKKVLVQEIIGYIQEHYSEELTLQTLAGKFNISENYLSSLVKKKTGKNFSDHLSEARIRNAQILLRTTNASIEEIAKKVGYPDYFYFSKVHKKLTGISPAAYRRQL